jgi:hypothetical protein
MSEYIKPIKEYAQTLPDPLRTLILSSPDDLTDQELISKFMEWRKLLRITSREVLPK